VRFFFSDFFCVFVFQCTVRYPSNPRLPSYITYGAGSLRALCRGGGGCSEEQVTN
jgi:hypothetical protein